MSWYLITGTQGDGEHEYYIFSLLKADREPTNDECQITLLRHHSFGFDGDDEDYEGFDIYDPNFNYGDGLTYIKHQGTGLIPDSEADVLLKYNVCCWDDLEDHRAAKEAADDLRTKAAELTEQEDPEVTP